MKRYKKIKNLEILEDLCVHWVAVVPKVIQARIIYGTFMTYDYLNFWNWPGESKNGKEIPKAANDNVEYANYNSKESKVADGLAFII